MAYLEGRLRENIIGPENEHTGYVLEIEADISTLQDPEELVNEEVAVTGDLEFIDYSERGKILIFRVTSAAAVEEETEETG